MNRYLALIALCFAAPSYASSDSFVVATSRGQVPVTATLDAAADFVAVPISVTSNEKDPLRNMENVQALMEKLKGAVRKSPEIKLRQGTISLSVTQGEEGFSSYKSVGISSSSNLYLIAPLANDRDVFQATREIIALAQSIPKQDQSRITFGATSLGIESPERFRTRLLALIQKEIGQVRSALGNSKLFEVSGLESPVVVMQSDDRNVVVYIPYRLKVGQ